MDIKSPFNREQGAWGAWQVAARYTEIDLNDHDVFGGKYKGITLGLNWYIYPNIHWGLNYGHFNIKDSYAEAGIDDADAEVFKTRLQVYF